ncbi:hypothetical protein KBK19_03435 [Microvirga sp. STR05]|uniref:Uncharacterized protein n=1 Tax=Hymenobacter duratus TaxID=2771356 RepID=A0ABR8JBU4_9BACT|nr:hypothetical protein [Hymenobacter duratus]MBD2714083.1 hypothetical protein [Hymenobacter duratus]MBR7948985.1 hypothetical protein [Microvirga sp. STR05]
MKNRIAILAVGIMLLATTGASPKIKAQNEEMVWSYILAQNMRKVGTLTNPGIIITAPFEFPKSHALVFDDRNNRVLKQFEGYLAKLIKQGDESGPLSDWGFHIMEKKYAESNGFDSESEAKERRKETEDYFKESRPGLSRVSMYRYWYYKY